MYYYIAMRDMKMSITHQSKLRKIYVLANEKGEFLSQTYRCVTMYKVHL